MSAAAWLVLSLPVTVLADEERDRFFQATIENDVYFHTDRYYTDGAQLMWGEAGGKPDLISRPLERYLCGPEQCPDDRRVLYAQKIGQLLYTPADITIAAAQPNDRPWAAFLYYGADSLYLDSDPTITYMIGYQVGVVGSYALGKQTQGLIHKNFAGRDANGWDNQLDNEPGIIVSYAIEKRLMRSKGELGEGVVWVSGGGAAGNVMTFASASAKLAFGRNLPIQVNPSQIGPKSMPMTGQTALEDEVEGGEQPAASGAGPMPTHKGEYGRCLRWFSACYAFLGVEGRAVARNIFLDGNTFQDNDGNVDKEILVYDFVIGFRLRFGSQASFMDGWYLDFSRTRRSSEFTTPAGDAPVQRFASITFGREY